MIAVGKNISEPNTDLLNSIWLSSKKPSMFGPEKTRAFLRQGWVNIEKGNVELTESPAGTYDFSLHDPQVTILGDNGAFTNGYLALAYTDPKTMQWSSRNGHKVKQLLNTALSHTPSAIHTPTAFLTAFNSSKRILMIKNGNKIRWNTLRLDLSRR